MKEQSVARHTGITCKTYEEGRLFLNWILLEGKLFRVHRGTWNFYVPSLNYKFPYVVNGKINCLHRSAPDRNELFAQLPDDQPLGTYTALDWKKALSKTSLQRAVENVVAGQRLHQANLGPRFNCFAAIRCLKSFWGHEYGECIGVECGNAFALPPKPKTREEEILEAGVLPDKIKSCVRQQINGYVTDLNSVVGVMPRNADNEIEDLLRALTTVLDGDHLDAETGK